MEIELSAILAALKKWFWIPVVLVVALGIVGYQLADRQTKTYTATSTIVVDFSVGAASTNTSTVSNQISNSYNRLLETDDFRNQVAAQANLDRLDDFDVSIVSAAGTGTLDVRVTHTDPAAALEVANATVDTIIVDYAQRSNDRLSQTTTSLTSELELMRAERDATEAQVAELEESGDTLTSTYRQLSNELTRLDQRIADIEARIDRMRIDHQLAEPGLVPITYTSPPTAPDNLRPELAGLLGAFLGGLLGAGFIVTWAMFNNHVRSTADWQNHSETRVLSEIPNAGQLPDGGQQVFLISKPTEAPAEGIRMLVTGLDFASFPTQNNKVLQITSPGPSDGKSTVSANLAVHFAQLGKQVLLVDCDLHRPQLGSIFSVSQNVGLTTLFRNGETPIRDVVARVALPGLHLLPSGPLPPSPAELFSSRQFEHLVHRMKTEFDIVILDTPPILLFSDSQRIASRSDSALAVGRLGKTKIPDMDQTLDELEKSRTDVLGTVWVGAKPPKNHYNYYRNRR